MKKIIPILFCVLVSGLFSARGQVVVETVGFDSYVSAIDNDFVNRFTNGFGLTQITTSGITGGCLTTPATMSWGNDNAIYCSKYIADTGSYCKTYITFKYDTTIFSSSGFDRAVSIFLRPSADFNHYVIASITHSQRIEILTYGWTNAPGPLATLIHNHWYEFLLRVIFNGGPTGDSISVAAAVTDLGVTGIGPQFPAGTAMGTFHDSVLIHDPAIQVSFTATANGAAKYLENFQFEGVKSADSCFIATFVPVKPAEDFFAFLSGNELLIQNAQATVAEIYSMNGQLLSSLPVENHKASVDVSKWLQGIYLVRLKTSQSDLVKKIAIFR